jgi:maleate isomerase
MFPDFKTASRDYGHHADTPVGRRLGVIMPSVNTVVEPWFNQAAPGGVQVHGARMLLDPLVTPDSLRRMDHEEGLPAARRLLSCRPHAVAYCCTASTIVQGLAYDQELQQTLESVLQVPCFTAVTALLDALRCLKVGRIAMASPYTDEIDRLEHRFFESAGYEVVGGANLGIADGFSLADPSSEQIYQLGLKAWHHQADALVVSCLNMNSQRVAHVLEKVIGKPVITSTTATLWKLLRSAGVGDRVSGYGVLLEQD